MCCSPTWAFSITQPDRSMHSVPCTLSGLTDYKALMRFHPPSLVLEFSAWSWSGFGNQVAEVVLTLDEIGHVEYKSGWLGVRIDIQLKSLRSGDKKLFRAGRPAGLVRLKASRKHADKALGLASSLALALSEHQLNSHYDADED